MPQYILQVGDLPPAYVTANDLKAAAAIAVDSVGADFRDETEGHNLTVTLKDPEGNDLLGGITVAAIVARP